MLVTMVAMSMSLLDVYAFEGIPVYGLINAK